ncbi:MAG TPA: acyl carrier protein [Alphaproteobacteria bacterium]|nr:acyl carrier protein [Alphaproteobacteria bacterium]
MSDTRQAIMNFLLELAPNDELRGQLTEDTELMEAGIIDSFGVVRLIQFVEEQFNLRIPDSDIGPALFASAAAISAYIERHRPQAAETPARLPAGV